MCVYTYTLWVYSSVGIAFMRPWLQTPTLKKKKKKHLGSQLISPVHFHSECLTELPCQDDCGCYLVRCSQWCLRKKTSIESCTAVGCCCCCCFSSSSPPPPTSQLGSYHCSPGPEFIISCLSLSSTVNIGVYYYVQPH